MLVVSFSKSYHKNYETPLSASSVDLVLVVLPKLSSPSRRLGSPMAKSLISQAVPVRCVTRTYSSTAAPLIMNSRGPRWVSSLRSPRQWVESSGVDGGEDTVGRSALHMTNTTLTRYHYGTNSYYEGHSMQDIIFPIRVLRHLGVDTLLCKTSSRCAF